MRQLVVRLARYWKQFRCEHYWRPALRPYYLWKPPQPVKVCDYCELEIELTPEMFYAQFGRIPY